MNQARIYFKTMLFSFLLSKNIVEFYPFADTAMFLLPTDNKQNNNFFYGSMFSYSLLVDQFNLQRFKKLSIYERIERVNKENIWKNFNVKYWKMQHK